MSSLAPTKREHPANTLPSRAGLSAWLKRYATSTVGQKFAVAITGTLLLGFVIAHMAGNLQIFAGPKKINDYAHMLKEMGPLLWAARFGLLAILLVHMLLSLSLKKRSVDARPIGYAHRGTIQASFASVTMVQTGLLIFVFIVYHIAHFTLGWTQTADGVNFLDLREAHDPKSQDVYRMMVVGFSNPWVALTYIVAQAVLFVHLSHGIASVFQTLGLNSPRTAPLIRGFGYTVAAVIFVGNCAIVAAVWSGYLH